MTEFTKGFWLARDANSSDEYPSFMVDNQAALGERLEKLIELQTKTNELLEALYETTPEGQAIRREKMETSSQEVWF